jgi:UDP-N-acetylglucosamine--N-acetylmuramyl-(pentapeptide) pyrophosphoryl-undecaprenol N-acetylglucosamine transferase
MEPNAMPGLTNRQVGRFVRHALLSFPQAARFFPPGKSEVTGLPVRTEFFAIPPKPREPKLTILITGGSQGSRTLNQAAAGSWRYFRENQVPVRFIHQTGSAPYKGLAQKFSESGMDGEVVPFIGDLPRGCGRGCRIGGGGEAVYSCAAADRCR